MAHKSNVKVPVKEKENKKIVKLFHITENPDQKKKKKKTVKSFIR